MSDENDGDLLGIETDADVARMLAGGEVPEHKWAPLLAELLRVFEAKFKRQGATPAEAFARAADVVLTLGEYLGGRMTYIPKGERLRVYLKHAQIWREFDGKNALVLAKNHNYSDVYMYALLAKLQAIHTRKVQPRLPGFDD